ncbi:MAG: sigma 54-interacting transcriptional regulator [Desulfosalsimonadaceae bacterium]
MADIPKPSSHPNPLQTMDAVVALSPALSVMSANHVIRWIIGREPKPGMTFPIDALLEEPELTRVRASIRHTLESGQTEIGYTVNLLCDAGITLSCNYTVYPVFDQKQFVIGVILSFRNPTPPSSGGRSGHSRVSLRHNPPDHDTLIDKLPEAVFTITPHWRISSFNQMAEKITGYAREEAIGKYCWEVFHSDKCKLTCPLRTALDSGQTAMDQEVRILNKAGIRQAILVNTSVLRDATGFVMGAVETFRPLTGEMYPPSGVDYHYSFADIVGKSESMQRLFEAVPDIAASEANVLITGESGTGKDLFARAIHNHSLRSKGPFIAVNCSSFAETLLESELFGHEKAAFTGAERYKQGRFEMAKGGTIFLDEIGDLKRELQVKLLRIIEQREFERVGGTRTIPLQARIISATNMNLTEAIREGRFREDFYYRLKTVTLTIPPLRDRREDIPLLVSYFIKKLNQRYHKNVRSVDTKVMRFFQKYAFPGNVRELERALEHAFVFVKGPVIFMSNLPAREEFTRSDDHRQAAPPPNLDRKSKDAVLWALAQTDGRRKEAAELLRMSRTSLWRLMKNYGLE